MVPTQQEWRQRAKKLMVVLSLMEAKLGSQMHLWRMFQYNLPWSPLTCEGASDIFIVWARCKWDGKVRGFVLEKVSSTIYCYFSISFLRNL